MSDNDGKLKPGETGQMHERAATLEQGGQHLQQTAAKQSPLTPGTGPMKFIYASGARPLEGYTIKRGVGIGGFGEVYFATSDAGKEVALKRIQRNLDVEVRGVTHCLNLKHPNLIAIYDIKYDDLGEGWIVMEYVAGESLKDVVDRNPNGMPLEEVRFWFGGIAAGVAYLHDHGIVHRDLKPGNLFRDEGVVKIGDYGLSKFISCSRRSGQTESVGTFHYMAPEIGKGVYGKEIDIYALGIILCEMLTGRVPFEGESCQEIIMKHLTADPDLRQVPVRFRRVIERALFKDPANRYKSVGDMLRAMQFDGGSNLPPAESRDAQPVISAEVVDAPVSADAPPIYIDDAGITTDEIVFGPVVQVVTSEAEKPPVVVAAAAGREPIAAAVGVGYQRFTHWWASANLNTPIKLGLVVGGMLLLVLNSGWLVPIVMILGATYLVYFGIRSVTMGTYGPQVPPAAPTDTGQRFAPQTSPHRDRRRQRVPRGPWRERARECLQHKPAGQRLTEVTGSFLMAAIVSAVLCLIILVAGGRKLDASVDTWTFYAWLTVTSAVGTWLVLGLAKFWEGTDGDDMLRRFVMMVAGLGIGVAAFAASDMLMIRLSTQEMFNVLELPRDMIPTSIYANANEGTLGLTPFLAYFGTLFVVLRWWRQVDPLRRTRFSVWTILVVALVAMLIPWQIPWGFLLAVTISVAVQLSAPWMNSHERSRIRQDGLEA
ncbi:MAG: serine/threonine-protein kinase [Pirellulaceae bacterium]